MFGITLATLTSPLMKLSLLLAAAFHVNADPTSVSDGTMLLGGKPFFPWGVYMQNATEDDLAYVRSAGFSTILSYKFGPTGLPQDGSMTEP